jgi:hypothetical protein
MATIATTSPPVGTPKRKSVVLTTSWVSLVTVDNYSVTRVVAGAFSTVTVGGVGEITSPLILTNVTTTARWASARIVRVSAGGTSRIIHQQLIPAGESLVVPINGQFLLTGDTLDIQAEANSAIEATLSWTQGEAEGDGS